MPLANAHFVPRLGTCSKNKQILLFKNKNKNNSNKELFFLDVCTLACLFIAYKW